MSAVTYCGQDFGPYASAELVPPAGIPMSAEAAAVPGRPGAVLLGADAGPLTMRVRIFLDARAGCGERELALARHRIRRLLLAPGGGELLVPGDPDVTYRDAVCTGVTDWSDDGAGAECEAEFTCFDAVGYGPEHESDADSFEVGGTWPAQPVVEMTAEAGDAVRVADASGDHVEVAHAFSGGEAVAIDFEALAATVDGEDATADIALGSTFFAIGPEAAELTFTGCTAHTVRWRERWA